METKPPAGSSWPVPWSNSSPCPIKNTPESTVTFSLAAENFPRRGSRPPRKSALHARAGARPGRIMRRPRFA